MATPFESVYNGTTQDSAINLADGSSVVSTTLALAMTVDDTIMEVVDAGAAPIGGVVVVDDELMYYEGEVGQTRVSNLRRGMGGTTAATHTATAVVTFYARAKFVNPAIAIAIQAMQADLVDALARIAALEAI